MQQNQSGRRFSDTTPQQPIYRFPQNQPAQGWQPQQTFSTYAPAEEAPLSRQDKRELKRKHKRRRRIFTWWNLFAVIGIVAMIIETIRYVIVPLLIYLNTLAGGAL